MIPSRFARSALVYVLALSAGCGGGPTETPDAAPDHDTDIVGPDAFVPVCTTDADCDDGLFCTGTETCASGSCRPGAPMLCDDSIACTRDACSETLRACSSRPPDVDGDGSPDRACLDGAGVPLGDDCDDADANRFPSNTEVCDATHDEDCDDTTLGGIDSDADRFVDHRCCNGTSCGADCNDAARGAHPGATEACNGIDDDCNGMVDEGVAVTGFVDHDADGYGDPAMPMSACGTAARFSPYGTDCDDDDVAQNPGQPEFCDSVDNDCDATVDEDAAAVEWYRDIDGDSFGNHTSGTLSSCVPPAGHSLRDTDCDDATAGINPGSAEQCNGLDDDCNGLADYRIAAGDFEDDDGDHVVDLACGPPRGMDCDDGDALTGAGSVETCDGRDNDCDTRVDEGATTLAFFRDEDGDGYGASASGAVLACTPPAGYARRGGDCDDADPLRLPGSIEGCNASDDDCDGAIDEGEASDGCALPHAVRACVVGLCRTLACDPGWATCDVADPPCETDILADHDRCGSCGRSCAVFEACSMGTCSSLP